MGADPTPLKETEMRRRALFGILSLGGLVAMRDVLGQPAAPPADSERQSAALPGIKLAILKATGYADAALTVALKADQFWVTIVNSPLNQATARQREAQAAQIAGAIADKVRQDPAFAAVLGIHIDYVARGADGSHSEIIDAIDFRKGPAGSFEHHTT